MEPYEAPLLPLKFALDLETKKLVKEVYFKFGEYKYALKTLKYDYKHFLDIMLFTDTLCTSNIEFQKLSKKDMFYIGYMKDEYKIRLVDNLRKSFVFGYQYVRKNEKYDLEFFNKMNKIILKKTKIPYEEIGKLRKGNAYIMKLGLVGKNIDYVAPSAKRIKPLMKNFLKYINESNDEAFIKMAICHYQFLTVHPYTKGNGRIARILLPIELYRIFDEEPILFMSEVLDKHKITYRRLLNETKTNGPLEFVKFFLKSIKEMCDINISKIEEINKIYEEDFSFLKENISGKLIYKIYPFIAKNVVFSVNDVVDGLKLHINSVNKVLKKLVELNILIKEKNKECNRVTYRYNKMYEIYVNEK